MLSTRYEDQKYYTKENLEKAAKKAATIICEELIKSGEDVETARNYLKKIPHLKLTAETLEQDLQIAKESTQNKGLTVEPKDTVKTSPSETEKALPSLKTGKYYALVIGIDDYRGEWPKLNNAVRDARAVKEVLSLKYSFDQIITFYNEQATRANILRKFEWLAGNLRKEGPVCFC